ncbi:MAG: hypothetical protein IJQ31_05220 [Thermoguttaceae bacterium]|nr:hypothetical protein [Thermoguttaceae bacterium]
MTEPDRDEMTDLLSKINEILWKDWDPIGVYQEPMPDVFDEYSGYANEILNLLYQYEIQRDKLENRLREIVRDEMGLTLSETVLAEKNRRALDRIYSVWNHFKSEHDL